jgi:hypothetical protein
MEKFINTESKKINKMIVQISSNKYLQPIKPLKKLRLIQNSCVSKSFKSSDSAPYLIKTRCFNSYIKRVLGSSVPRLPIKFDNTCFVKSMPLQNSIYRKKNLSDWPMEKGNSYYKISEAKQNKIDKDIKLPIRKKLRVKINSKYNKNHTTNDYSPILPW